ncbi:MAG: PEGA domain-containing protein [Bacteroidales bacterium]
MKKLSTILLATTILFMTSCATLFTGTKQTVQINSKPSGAKVQVDGIDRGTTPIAVKLKKGYNGQVVTLKLDGFETKTFQPETGFNEVAVLNFFNILFWGIDAASGALWKYDPKFYEIELEPKKVENK